MCPVDWVLSAGEHLFKAFQGAAFENSVTCKARGADGRNLLKEIVPGLSRVAVMWKPGAASEFQAAFASMSKEHVGALVLLADSMFGTYRTQLVNLVRADEIIQNRGEERARMHRMVDTQRPFSRRSSYGAVNW